MIIPSNAAILAVVLYSIALPAALLIWWKKRTGEPFRCFLAGAICFTLFAMVLEQISHAVFLAGDNAVSEVLTGSPAAYTLYGSLAAGIFEETGRLFGFKVLLKKHREKACAAAYGIGHGGMEVILVLGMTYLIYLLAKCGVPMGSDAATESILTAANGIGFGTACAAMFERISAMMAHVGLSMLMFLAARQKGKLWLYPVSILLHAFLDVPSALYQYGVITSVQVIEAAAFVTGLICLLAGKKLLDRYSEPK